MENIPSSDISLICYSGPPFTVREKEIEPFREKRFSVIPDLGFPYLQIQIEYILKKVTKKYTVLRSEKEYGICI